MSKAKTISRRSATRLAAVQALYEMEIVDAPADPVLEEFLASRWPDAEREDGSTLAVPEPDKTMLRDLVRGVNERKTDLDGMIEAALTGEWSLDSLDVLLRTILRAGVYELLAKADVPTRVVLNEYVDMVHAFYEGPETGMVNSVLDRLAHKLREAEFEGG